MSNYDKTKHEMSAAFLTYDQETMIHRFRLRHDEDYLYLRSLAREYRISRSTGLVEWSSDGFATTTEADFNEAMTFYDYLCYSKPGCRLAGEFIAMSQLARLQSGSLAPGGDMFGSKAFAHRTDDLARACEALGGSKASGGDVAYLLPLVDCLPVILRYWDADEEFPSSLQLSWDKNTLDFLHYETACFAAGMLLRRLREAMDQASAG